MGKFRRLRSSVSKTTTKLSKTTKRVASSKITKNVLKSAVAITVATIPMSQQASAVDIEAVPVSKETLEGGKEALNAALKTARSKPALSIAAGITCLACLPAGAIAASPSMCFACGILIAKVLG